MRSPGYIYLMKIHGTNGVHKIGATVDIASRITRMEKEKSWELKCVGYFEIDGDFNECLRVEQELHRYFANYRLAGEWFVLPSHVVDTFEQEVRAAVVELENRRVQREY